MMGVVVNAPETPVQAEVIFAIEATAVTRAYINELKTNYIIPTLEYFHGGALEEGGGNGSVFSIITYKSADCHPGQPVDTYGPFNTAQNVLETIDKIAFVGGQAESKTCVIEALVTAIECFEELGRTDIPNHLIMVCATSPYSTYGGGLVPPGVPATVEQAARLLAERGVQVSVIASRKSPTFLALFEQAGGELHAAQQRNYAKDPRHLVLLRGYSLKERPPSPAPPPVPEIQTEVYGQGRGMVGRGAGAAVPGAGPPGFPRAPRPGWLPPPRPPLYANNSALLTQLAQPSYPPQRLPTMLNAGASGSSSPAAPAPAPAPPAQLQRAYIWSGVIEWIEKGKTPGEQKVTKVLPCQVSSNSKDIEPELKVETWPNKLLMQLMPKQLISNIGGQHLKDSKSVLFHLQPNEALDALTKVMVNGYAGCVHFSSPPQCDIKVLILLYTPEKKAFLGFIPNNQVTFVDRLRKVIQQQKMTHLINKGGTVGTMGGTMPTATMTGSTGMPAGGMSSGMGGGMQASMSPGMQSGMSSGMQPGMSSGMQPGMSPGMQPGMSPGMQPGMSPGMQPGMSQGMQPGMSSGMQAGGLSQQNLPNLPLQQGMSNQHNHGNQQGMMMGGGKGARGVPLDGLEAARQQNLEKIQHLQQTLEAAHQQQEANFKSQMDIMSMSHLHAAQQQEMNYKQLEEQRKHQLQQQQLQQQQLQQLRGSSAAHSPRIMRPMMPSNPGLRHLLQQQPQYRPGAPRAPSQPQQFDDVNNYDFL